MRTISDSARFKISKSFINNQSNWNSKNILFSKIWENQKSQENMLNSTRSINLNRILNFPEVSEEQLFKSSIVRSRTALNFGPQKYIEQVRFGVISKTPKLIGNEFNIDEAK